MPGLTRTDLQTSQKVDLAATALVEQGAYGAVTRLAESFAVSRPTVYRAADEANAVLEKHFDEPVPKSISVLVDEAQLTRALVGLRVIGPLSIRQMEDLIPVIYPELHVSYGKIQGILAQAEEVAARHNQQADLSAIHAGAVDEMFSQGDPVLAGIDLNSAYLFALALREGRSSEEWAEVLREAQRQGLNLEVVVKDAARGIEAGVREVFPQAEQRDDCFHAIYAMGKVRQRLERRAYGAMRCVEEAKTELEKCRQKGRSNKKRRKLVQKVTWAQRKCEAAMTLHDTFERACRQAREAMEIVDLEHGVIRQVSWLQSELEVAAAEMMKLDDQQCRDVGRYLRNRAPGLVLYAAELHKKLGELSLEQGDVAVQLACIVWRLTDDLENQRRPWRRRRDERHLVGAYAMLGQLVSDVRGDEIIAKVDTLMQERYRASSAIEGFNAFLRPYLYVHKGVSQSFLELLRAYYNLRTRRWGRHQGTSAYTSLTGVPVEDWLSVLGYPPNLAIN